MKHTCFICGNEATKRITTTADQGEFYLCSEKVCKDTLEEQLMVLNIKTMKQKYHPSDFQGRSKQKYESQGKVMMWTMILGVCVFIAAWLVDILTNL